MKDGPTTNEPCPVGCGPAPTVGAANGEDVYRCPACGLLFYAETVRNRPAADEDWWAGDNPDLVPSLRHGRNDMAEAFDRQLATLEAMTPGRRLVDIGAGAGIFLACARDRGWTVVGQDKNPNAAGAANLAFGALDYVAELNDIADGSADVVRISHVLEHVAEPIAFLDALKAKLKPGGVLSLIVPNGAPLTYSTVNALRRIVNPHPRLAAPLSPGFHLLGLSPEALSRLAQAAGYTVERIASVSMGDRTFYPMFYDGLIRRVPVAEIPIRMLIRYWMPFLVDNLGNPFGKGQWLTAYFRKPE